jgi:hypothetical protein
MVRDSAAPALTGPTLLQRIGRFFARLFARLFGHSATPSEPKFDDGIGSDPGSGSQTWPDPGPPPRM